MLYFIPTPIGNLSDITIRTLQILKTCENIICEDTRVCKSLFALLNAKFDAKLNPKRFISLHSHNESEFMQNLDESIFQGNVAYLSDAGMPCISDPGVFLVRLAQKKGIDYEVLSGANAALIAVAASGLCEKEFIFMGFLSNKGKNRQKDIQKMLSHQYVCVVYESAKRILALINAIALIDGERELFAIKEISKKFEKKFKAKAKDLSTLLENENLNGEWVLVVAGKKAQSENGIFLSKDDIMALGLSTKEKAKLLAQFMPKQTKEIYYQLLS